MIAWLNKRIIKYIYSKVHSREGFLALPLSFDMSCFIIYKNDHNLSEITRKCLSLLLKAVEENLSEDEKTSLENLRDVARLSVTSAATTGQATVLGGALAQLIGTMPSGTATDASQTEYLKLQSSTKSQDSSMKLVRFLPSISTLN